MNETMKPASVLAAADAALDLRYREPVAGATKPWNDTLAVMLAHRSVRAFLPTPLPEGTLEMLVAAAQSAPTSSNVQAWSVVAVSDPERKARLALIADDQAQVHQAPVILVWIADYARIDAVARSRGITLETLAYTEAFLVASMDAAFAAQNALTAAESLGLGTCYIGALRNNIEAVAEILKLPKHCYPVFGLVVGQPDPARPADVKPRLPQDAVLHFETYSQDGQADAVARHDRHSLDFRREQKLDATPWSNHTIERLDTIPALRGRHLLRQALERLGFPLA